MLKELAQEIAKSISEIINCNVIITDEFGIIIGCSDNISRLGTLHEASIEVIKCRKHKSHDHNIAKLFKGVKPGITSPIELANRVVGTVGIAGEPEEVEKFILIVKKQVEILLREEVLLKSSLLHERAVQNLIQEISVFDPRRSDEVLILTRGQELGYDLTLQRVAIVIDLYRFGILTHEIQQQASINDSPELLIQSIKLDVLMVIKNIFNLPQDICTPIGTDKFVVLHEVITKKEENEILLEVKKKCSRIVSKLQAQGIIATIGIGSMAKNLFELGGSYRDAWQALTIGKRLSKKPMIFSIQELYLEELLSNVNKNTCQRLISKILMNLENQSDWSELFRTIRAWCESGFSPIKASKILNIHRNTLFYRITKIEQITGMNLRNFKDAISLYLAVIITTLNENKSL